MQQAIVVAPALATSVAEHLLPGANVTFLTSPAEISEHPIDSSCCVAFSGSEVLMALLRRRDVTVKEVVEADGAAVAFLDADESVSRKFTADEVVCLLKVTSESATDGNGSLTGGVPQQRDAEATALHREIAALQDENRRHRSRIAKIKRHPLGRLALRANRMLKRLKK